MKLEVRVTLLNINICGISLQETIIHFHKNGRQTFLKRNKFLPMKNFQLA